jgi:soluble lytic murein transglycosylase
VGVVRCKVGGVLVGLLALSAAAQPGASEPPASDAGAAPPVEMHEAPTPLTKNGPPESELAPPPDAEKEELELGFVEIDNPAFPPRELAPAPTPVASPGRRYDATDVAAYFQDGVLAQARAEFDKGHYPRVRQLLEGAGDAAPVRYLRAVASLKALDYARAADELTALALSYPALRDLCLSQAGTAEEELLHWAQAGGLYAQVSKDARQFPDARLGLYRTLRRQGNLAAAQDAVAPIADWPAPGWGRDVGAEALLALSDLAHLRRDASAERAALVKIWAGHPLAALARVAERRLAGKMPVEAQVAHAEALIDANRNAAGLTLLQPLLAQLKLPDPVACRASFALGKALRKERQHARAIQTLTPVVERCKDPDLRPRALYVLGSSKSIVDIPHGAKVYETLARDYPTHPFADDALFYAADIYVHLGDLAGALARLEDLWQRYPQSDFAGEALFRSFWLHRARGETDAALAALDAIDARFKDAMDPYEVERSQYWRARTVASAERVKAADLYEVLAKAHPTTYYGYVARVRLGELDEARGHRVVENVTAPATGDDAWPLFAGPMSDDPHLQAGVELLRLGFKEQVAPELFAINRANEPASAVRLLVHLLALAGETQAAHGVARVSLRRDLSGRIERDNRRLWEIAYPRAFRDSIDKHCKPAHVDPDLVQALMREESALDPKALSWAGALGLTQLMLPTARSVARTLKIPRVTEALLLEPDLNIQIGSFYLGELMRQFKGQKELALAGYNAGGFAVTKWRNAKPGQPIDEWVEEIPYSETRGYVKRVLRTFATYQLLYPPPPAESPGAPRAEANHG